MSAPKPESNADAPAAIDSSDALRFATAVLESSDDAIITKDLNGIITTWNKGAERIFGYTPEEVIGKPVTLLMPPELLDEEPGILARLRRGERIDHYETVRKCKDGRCIDISLTVSPVRNEEGRIIGASKIARDVTELRKAREALARSHEELEIRVKERTASLEQAVAQMEEFSYTVSHDLRSPIRAIKGFAEAALEDYDGKLDKGLRTYLERIVTGAERMEHLAQDILKYSKVARSPVELKPISLDRLVPQLVANDAEIQRANAEVSVRKPLDPVLGHESLVSQAILNLLSNAAKFVKPGTRPKIEVGTERNNGRVKLWVKDNGIGIDPRYHGRLFGIFERLNPAYEGTGIGLAIVRKAAERMGGSVGLESDVDHGSSFWIELGSG
jgi:PAS domain S-box-containing protein